MASVPIRMLQFQVQMMPMASARRQRRRASHPPQQEPSQPPTSHLYHTAYRRTVRQNDDWSTPQIVSHNPQPHLGTFEGNRDKNQDHVPFVAAAQQNDKNSPIYRLPNSVLVRLLEMLDPVSVECLRRTGRIFLQIFDVCHHWPTRTMYPWSIPKLVMTELQRQTLKQLLEKDAYCSGCWESLGADDRHQRVARAVSTYLHCSGCQRDHPACLFTPRQRRAEKEIRLCVGHTGHVRLCQHRVLTWDQVMFAQRHCPEEAILEKCRDGVHAEPCEFLPHGGLVWRIFRSNNHDTLSERPAARLTPNETGPGVISLSWTAHVKLAASASGGEQRQVTASSLMNHFAKLRSMQARFICPELEPGRVVELRLFDPNNCDCVRHVELENLTNQCWNRSPNNRMNKEDTSFSFTHGCLNEYRNVQRLPPLVRAQKPRPSGDHDDAQRAGRKGKKRPPTVGGRAADESRHLSADLIRPRGATAGQKICTTVRPCRGGGDCLQVDYRWEISAGDAAGEPFENMGSGWFQALDPESFEMEQDDDGYGLYWCRTESCRNHWRYTSLRLRPWLRHEDYWAPCSRGLGGKCAEP